MWRGSLLPLDCKASPKTGLLRSPARASSLATGDSGELFARLQNQIERRLRRPAEVLEPSLGKHFAQAHFTRLRAEPQADFLDSEFGVQIKVEAA